MIEHFYFIGFAVFSILSMYLLTRIKLIPAHKTGLIERFGAFHKSITPGIHFLIPFVDRMIVFDVRRKLNLNREILSINGEPRLSLSMEVDYQVIDEKAYYGQNVDQFMKQLILESTRNYIHNYGTTRISEQRIAFRTRLRCAILERVVEWGIQLSNLDLLMVMEIPKYQ